MKPNAHITAKQIKSIFVSLVTLCDIIAARHLSVTELGWYDWLTLLQVRGEVFRLKIERVYFL